MEQPTAAQVAGFEQDPIGAVLMFLLNCGLENETLADLTGAKWTGTLPHSGTYALDVFGSGDGDPTTRSAYTIRLHIN